MKYSVIKSGGKQYKVTEGTILELERLPQAQNEEILFSEVLLAVSGGDVIQIGTPYLSNVTVKGKILDQIRGEKIRVSKFKAKARYRRVTGHRQALSKVLIEKISIPGEKEEKVTVSTQVKPKAPAQKKKV